MLPILATVGSALAWFAATAGQLIFWGAGISVGIWIAKKGTNLVDQWALNKKANQLGKAKYGIDEDVIVATAATLSNPS